MWSGKGISHQASSSCLFLPRIAGSHPHRADVYLLLSSSSVAMEHRHLWCPPAPFCTGPGVTADPFTVPDHGGVLQPICPSSCLVGLLSVGEGRLQPRHLTTTSMGPVAASDIAFTCWAHPSNNFVAVMGGCCTLAAWRWVQ